MADDDCSYRMAAELSYEMGDFMQACEWAEKGLELTKVCTGTDYVRYEQDEELLHDLTVVRNGMVKLSRARS